MMKNNISEKYEEKNYDISSLWRIFFARFIDIIFTSIPSLIFVFLVSVDSWEKAIYSMMIGIFSFFSFLVFTTFVFKTKTIGKSILRIKVVCKFGAVKKKHLLLRELYFIGIPYTLLYLLQIIGMVIFENFSNRSDNPYENGGIIILLFQNFTHLFLLLWSVYIFISVKLQEEQQSNIDIKFGLYVVNINTETKKKLENEFEFHSHMGEFMPGKIDMDELEKEIESKED